MKPVLKRVLTCVRASIPKAIRTSLWLLVVILPISLVVLLLEYFGMLDLLAGLLAPLFSGLGLSGTAPLVFITAASLNLYSAIAVIQTLSLGMREVTILAIMCLIAHNLPVETAIQRKTGSPLLAILATRIGAAIIGALLLSVLLPAEASPIEATYQAAVVVGRNISMSGFLDDLPALFRAWLESGARTAGMIISIVAGLMILQNLLQEFGLIRRLTSVFRPMLKAFGLPVSTHFLWIVANTLGLAYGAAVLIEEVESGRLGRPEADLLNRHIAVSHSLLEDTLLFVAIGVGAFWITIPRIVLAIGSVWLTRGIRRLSARRPVRSHLSDPIGTRQGTSAANEPTTADPTNQRSVST